MERSFQSATPRSETDAAAPSESWLFAQAILGKPIPDPQAAAKRAQADRELLERLATFSTRHEIQLRQLLSEEAAAREAQTPNPWAPAPSAAQEAWDPSKHPRQGGPPNAGWFATNGGSGGASGGTHHFGFDSDSNDAAYREPTADMLTLAHAWWQTNELLQQSHHAVERLPARIASERNQLGTGGRYAYVHVQNLAQAKRDLANAKAAIPELTRQLRELEQLYRDSGYHKIPYSAWTPAETLIGGVGIQAVGRAVANAGTPAGLRSTGIEFDVAMGAPAVLQLGKAVLRRIIASHPKTVVGEAAVLRPYHTGGRGHHVPAKKAFEGAPSYNPKAALAIPAEELAKNGWKHTTITGAQQTLYREFGKTGQQLTWDAMLEIETKALVHAGMKPDVARATVKKAIEALKQSGVTGPTRIPWSK